MEDIKSVFLKNMRRLQEVELRKSPILKEYDYLVYQKDHEEYVQAVGPKMKIFEIMKLEFTGRHFPKLIYMISPVINSDYEQVEPEELKIRDFGLDLKEALKRRARDGGWQSDISQYD